MSEKGIEHLISNRKIKCGICKSNELEIREFHTRDWNNKKITVKNIECLKCGNLMGLKDVT